MKKRVLFVEDDVELGTLVQYALKLRGHTICVAHNFEEALESFTRNVPDVVVVDYHLPTGNGIDLLRQFRQITDRRFVRVMVTAFPYVPDAEYEGEVDAFYVKPVSVDQLINLVEDNLFV